MFAGSTGSGCQTTAAAADADALTAADDDGAGAAALASHACQQAQKAQKLSNDPAPNSRRCR